MMQLHHVQSSRTVSDKEGDQKRHNTGAQFCLVQVEGIQNKVPNAALQTSHPTDPPEETPCAVNQRHETLLNYTTASKQTHTPTHLDHYKDQHIP
jgi:hypothetical protein